MARAEIRTTCPEDTSDGAWLDLAALRKCLDGQILATAQAHQLTLYEAENTSKAIQIAAMTEQLDNNNALIIKLNTAAKTNASRVDALQQRLDAWYHNPLILTGLGLVVGVAGTSILVITLK